VIVLMSSLRTTPFTLADKAHVGLNAAASSEAVSG